MTNLCKNDGSDSIKTALKILGDKYSALMIKFMHEKPQRFKDFEQNIPGISPRTLSQRLAMLETSGIISKHVCPDSPGRNQYELTQAGQDLDQVIHCMANWGEKHSIQNV